jgi:hypothetical protein
MKHKHTLRKIRINRIFKKVDKEYEEYTKKYHIQLQPITSANEEGLDTYSLESIKYWIALNKALNKGE